MSFTKPPIPRKTVRDRATPIIIITAIVLIIIVIIFLLVLYIRNRTPADDGADGGDNGDGGSGNGCQSNADCTFPTDVCIETGECVECALDTQCGGNEFCINNVCVICGTTTLLSAAMSGFSFAASWTPAENATSYTIRYDDDGLHGDFAEWDTIGTSINSDTPTRGGTPCLVCPGGARAFVVAHTPCGTSPISNIVLVGNAVCC